MLARFLVVSFILALCSATSRYSATKDYDDVATTPAVRTVIKYVKSLYETAGPDCLDSVGRLCVQYWRSPSGALACARSYASTVKGRCLLG